jgi:NCS2 family nucleobase:cation symporter-2/xanthine permease XanP
VGLQHVLAMFVGIITPPLIISRALDFSPSQTAYLVSMALVASGLATLVQVRRFGPVSSGLLSVQGTSLAFLTPLIQAGHLGGLPLMLGMSLALSPVEMVLSSFLARLRRILTPLVSGVVVLLIGISLVPVGVKGVAAGLGGGAPSLVPVGVKGVAAGLGGGAPPWAGLAVAGLVVGVDWRWRDWWLVSSWRCTRRRLGASTVIERIEVRWPSGQVQVLLDVTPNQELLIDEP